MRERSPEQTRAVEEACRSVEEEFERTGVCPLPAPIRRFSLGAFFMAPIWGPGHGYFITLLFYPLWIFCDSVLRAAVFTPSVFATLMAVVVVGGTAALMVFFAVTATPKAYWRVHDKYTPEEYARRERFWDVAMIIIALALLAGATYYNLYYYEPPVS
jgi:hypothetical protein